MKQTVFEIKYNAPIAANTYLMRLEGDITGAGRPGTFVNIKLEGKYLRRPISVCDCDDSTLTIVYKTVGSGTRQMSEMAEGAKLDVLTGLGNGYDLTACGDRPLLIGGGVGVPPLYLLCKKLCGAGKKVTVILGFNRREEVFFEEEFRAMGAQVYVTTADGSYGKKGFVTTVMPDVDYDCFFTCGPEPMLKAVYEASGDVKGQFSFEERMGCGFGACMGCSCKTKYGNKRICRDGPVLYKEEIIW